MTVRTDLFTARLSDVCTRSVPDFEIPASEDRVDGLNLVGAALRRGAGTRLGCRQHGLCHTNMATRMRRSAQA